MPDNEFALEPVLDAPPPAEIHEYMTPGIGNSITVLDDFAQNAVDEFKKERLELDVLEDDTPASNLPKVETSVSELAGKLGGLDAVEALATVINNPNSDLSQILPAESVESLVWSALDNPVVQSTVLADPSVRAAISSQLLFGHSIEDVQALLNQYQHGSHSPEQLEAEYVAAETRVAEFQKTFFTHDIDETVASFDLDESDPEPIKDAVLLAQAKFLQSNHTEYLHVQSLHERGLTSQAAVSEARLQNKFKAAVLKELQKLKGKPVSKVKATDAKDPKEDRPAKPIDVTDGHGGWVRDFVIDFKQERQRRGLLTAEEKRQQGKH